MAKVLISVIGIAVCFYYTLEIVEVETTEDKKGEEEGSDDAIFIPLGFYHECPPTYYKSSDPEWKAFGEFANDRAKRQRVTRKYLSSASMGRLELKVSQVKLSNYLKSI